MEFYRFVIAFYVGVIGVVSIIAGSTTTTTTSNVTNLQVCHQTVNKNKNISEFGVCINKEINLKDSLLKLETDRRMKNFSCCFNELTASLERTNLYFKGPKVVKDHRVTNHSEVMISCAITGTSYAKVSIPEKIKWSMSLPSTIQRDILQHHYCRNAIPGDESLIACCAAEYHDVMERKLTANCVKEAMMCSKLATTPIPKIAECNTNFSRCIARDYCSLGVKVASYKTVYAKSVKECVKQNPSLEDKISCILKATHISIPDMTAYQYLYCYNKYAKQPSTFFTCVNNSPARTKARSIYDICYTDVKKTAVGS